MAEISQVKFSKLAGVSKAAISKAIKTGLLKLTPSKKINDSGPLSLAYLRKKLEGSKKKIIKAKNVKPNVKQPVSDLEKLKALIPKNEHKAMDNIAKSNKELIKPLLIAAEKMQKKQLKQSKTVIPEPSKEETEQESILYQSIMDKETIEIELKKAQTEKVKVSTAQALKKLVPVDLVKKKFGKLSAVILNYYLPMGDRLAPLVCGICEVTDAGKIAEVKKMIDNEITRALAEFKKEAAEGMEE